MDGTYQQYLIPAAIIAVVMIVVLVWLLSGAAKPAVGTRRLDKGTYVILVRAIDRRLRRAFSRSVFVSVGTYAVKQGSRCGEAMIRYGVLDEVQAFAHFDFDSQQAKAALNAVPRGVTVVALHPPTRRTSDGREIRLEPLAGCGFGHKSRQEVERMRHIWRSALNDFLEQLNQELHRADMAAPAVIVVFLSSGGHAFVSEQAIKLLREQNPRSLNTVIVGLTVVPHEPAKRREFADFVEAVVNAGHLDYLLMTDNLIAGGPCEQHDDMIAHVMAAVQQSARGAGASGGANIVNTLADSTITREEATPRTRLQTIEYVQEWIGFDRPLRPNRLRRLIMWLTGNRLPALQTSEQVLIHRGSHWAAELAEGRGKLAGPLPFSPDTATTVVVGLPSSDAQGFQDRVAAPLKRTLEDRGLHDTRRARLHVARYAIPADASFERGVPLVGVRIGEMAGPLERLLELLRRQAPAVVTEDGRDDAALTETMPAAEAAEDGAVAASVEAGDNDHKEVA